MMRDPKRSDREAAHGAVGADLGRRRLLLAIAALPFAASAASTFAGCSAGEESGERGQPAGGASAPERAPEPEPAAKAEPTAEAPAASAPTPPSGHESAGLLITEIDAMKPTVQALQYAHESTRPDQRCSNCQFYTAKSAQRGSCQLFTQGLVEAAGWCSSWTKIATGA